MTTRPIVRTIRNLWIVDFWRLWMSASCPGSVPTGIRGRVRRNVARNHQIAHNSWPCAEKRHIERQERKHPSRGPSPPQAGVLAIRRHQLVVAPKLGNTAVDHYRNSVCIVCGVQPMRNRHDGTTLQ